MARLKIEIAGRSLKKVILPVRITDINYGNHTGNDAIVGIIHEARMKWLYDNNYTELNIDGVGLIMSDLALEFKNESFYGDVLEVEIFGGELSSKSFELYYSISTIRNNTFFLIAKAKTGMVCYDYTAKKITEMPQVLRKFITGERG
jgi:acyl-CoA thioesterase FadM